MRLGFKEGGVYGTIRESSHGGEVMGNENKDILGEWEVRIMFIIMYHRMVCLWDVGGII
jgi:hypothetical protein